MGVHYAVLFDYQEYQTGVRRLIEQLDQQDYMLLRNRACEAVVRMRQNWPRSDLGFFGQEDGVWKKVLTQEWPLLWHGCGGLTTEEAIKNKDAPTARDIGYWLLIVLAEYTQPCPSPLGNWSVVHDALVVLDWDQRDADLLFKGLPTHRLLKPDVVEQPPRPLAAASPYWFWLHPGQAESGWLSSNEIGKLHDDLRRLEAKMTVFDVRLLPHIDVENPVVIREYKGYLREGYRNTLAMLSAAQELNQGLFMSVTLP